MTDRSQEDGQDRELPSSLDAEQELLGAILINNDAYWPAAPHVTAEDFYAPQHGQIYEACSKLIRSDQIANPITLQAAGITEAISDVGGFSYLVELASKAVGPVTAAHYARVVKDHAARRALIGACEETVSRAMDFDIEDPVLRQAIDLDMAASRVMERLTHQARNGSVAESGERVHRRAERLKAGEPDNSVTTGLNSLDQVVATMRPGQLTYLAARPSMGKTSMGLQVAKAAARSGVGVAFISLEMMKDEITPRLMADLAWRPSAPISYFDYIKGRCDDEQMRRMADVVADLKTLPIWFEDTAAMTTAEITAALRAVRKRYDKATPLGLIVIDYLTLISDSGRYREQRVYSVAEISADLKRIAKQFECPVLCLAQLTRAVENRDDKRPKLHDLRESGSIEQDADGVWFLYRHEKYLGDEPADVELAADWRDDMAKWANKAELIIAKNRNGPVKTVHLFCDIKSSVFRDAEYRE